MASTELGKIFTKPCWKWMPVLRTSSKGNSHSNFWNLTWDFEDFITSYTRRHWQLFFCASFWFVGVLLSFRLFYHISIGQPKIELAGSFSFEFWELRREILRTWAHGEYRASLWLCFSLFVKYRRILNLNTVQLTFHKWEKTQSIRLSLFTMRSCP